MTWAGGALTRAELRSRLGGVARIRTSVAVRADGAPTAPASSNPNPNPFFRVHDPGTPVVHPDAPAAAAVTRAGVVTDIRTERNSRIVLTA